MFRQDLGALFNSQHRHVEICAVNLKRLLLLNFNNRRVSFHDRLLCWEIFNVCKHVGAPFRLVGVGRFVFVLLVEAQKVLLSVGANLAASASANVLLDQTPVFAVQLETFKESSVLVVTPTATCLLL